MHRRLWILALFMGAGCSTRLVEPVFPATLSSGWRLKSKRGFPAVKAPEMVRRIGVRGWWRAEYEGQGTAVVDVYATTSGPGGLDMVQQWRAAADTVVWYTTRYFVVVKWQSTDRAAVGGLVRDLQKQFGEQQ